MEAIRSSRLKFSLVGALLAALTALGVLTASPAAAAGPTGCYLQITDRSTQWTLILSCSGGTGHYQGFLYCRDITAPHPYWVHTPVASPPDKTSVGCNIFSTKPMPGDWYYSTWS